MREYIKIISLFFALAESAAFGAVDSYECGELLTKKLIARATEISAGKTCKLASAFFEDANGGHKRMGAVFCADEQAKEVRVYEAKSLDLNPLTCEAQEILLTEGALLSGIKSEIYSCMGISNKHNLGAFAMQAGSFQKLGLFDPVLNISFACSFTGVKACNASGNFKGSETIYEIRGAPLLHQTFDLENPSGGHLMLDCGPMKW